MNMASSPILLTIILSMWLIISCSESTEYLVGEGSNPWRFPLPSFHAFTIWSSTHQFTIGDTIVFEYDNKKEWVLEVDEQDYIKCNTRGKHEYLRNAYGNTKVVLDKVGVRYFISGKRAHCHMGLKVRVVVIPLISPSPPPSLSSPSLQSPPLPPSLSSPLQSPLPSLPLSTSPSPSLSPSLLRSLSPVPSQSPSLLSSSTTPSSSLSLLPNSSGSEGDAIGRGFMWLEILLAMTMFLI